LKSFVGALGATDGRALTAWIGTLHQAGLSSRAIATAALEAAPLIGANLALVAASYAARQLVGRVITYFRNNVVREVLREQAEQRR
jgi:hypothetical protein